MTWTLLANVFPIARRWTYTPRTSSEWIRLSSINPPEAARLRLCQFDGISFIEHPKVWADDRLQVICLPNYEVLEAPRALGFRIAADSPNLQSWLIKVEVSNVPFYNPSQIVQTKASATTMNPFKVLSAAESTPIIDANPNRVGLLIYNASTQYLYIDHDGAVTLTEYAAPIPPGGTYEVPFEYVKLAVTGWWVAENGFAQVREFVA